METTLCADRILSALHTKSLGRHIEVFDCLPSTNTCLKERHQLPHGTVVIADTQTAGRGRRGRSFFSDTGGIYMSILLRRTLTEKTVGLLTSAAAIAVAKGCEAVYPVNVQIKWVNDLLVNGKKICGILTEGDPANDWAVVGIGINVDTAAFPPEIADIASSLYKESGIHLPKETLVAAVLNAFEPLIDQLEDAAFLEETRHRSAVIGKPITVFRGNETFEATALDIDQTGALVIQRNGENLTLSSGEVSVRL